MDFFTKYKNQIARRFFIYLLLQGISAFAVGLSVHYLLPDNFTALWLSFAITYIIASLFAGAFIFRDSVEPVRNIWDVIQFISPNSDQHISPDLDHARIGRDMVSSLANHVYQLASVVDDVERTKTTEIQDIHSNFVANSLPLPLFVINAKNEIVYVNEAGSKYMDIPAAEFSGQNIYTALDMSFASEDTFESWLKKSQQKSVISDHKWERVRIGLPGQKNSKQFDLAAHYNRNNPLGYETLLILFDHTEIYSQDDQAMSFVSLSVHELRTPLTLLRGYIEVFDSEIGPTLNEEMRGFMKKMDASAQQLTAFVNNILNVAKIEDDQLTLQLHEDNWADIIQMVVSDLSLRAGVRGISIHTDIAEGLPKVGVDRYSIYEAIANLLDNAIKYSGDNKEIQIVSKLNSEGLVETSVTDHGLGIDENILPHIFDKFYRNHRNRAQIGGTGLGLFLCRSIVQAHGGQIQVNSKTNHGSTFTFTVVPYSMLTQSGMANKGEGMVRGAHGWIRNHSLYRE